MKAYSTGTWRFDGYIAKIPMGGVFGMMEGFSFSNAWKIDYLASGKLSKLVHADDRKD